LATDKRIAVLKNQVTALLDSGRIKTTQARAIEVKKIAEGLIALAVKEHENFTTRQITVSSAKVDSKGKKLTKTVESKNGKSYEVIERENRTEMVTVDNPSRLAARRQILRWVNKTRDTKGNNKKIVNKLFDEIATKFKDKKGGYTRIYKLGPRRGDAAFMVILELVD
jgi:large subunit ribosomal protein L17